LCAVGVIKRTRDVINDIEMMIRNCMENSQEQMDDKR
jgi:DNA polymerase/3'-5' exonuclease PolX